jgi:nucleoid DNA-binding protein
VNTQQMVSQIARRLPGLHKREVQEVVDLLFEVWRQELAKPDGELHLRGLGKLYVEIHPLRANGVTRQALIRKYGAQAPEQITRRTIRFRSYDALRAVMHEEAERDE